MKQRIYLFTHIPHTGGVSFTRWAFEPNFKKEEIVKFSGYRALLGQDHSRHQVIREHFPYGIHVFLPSREARYVCLLRDPLERSVSEYYMRRGAKRADYIHPDYELANSLTLSEWVNLERNRNVQTKCLAGLLEWKTSARAARPGLFRILFRQDAMLKKAREHMQNNYAFVGLMEDMEESARRFCAKEQLQCDVTIAGTPNAYSGDDGHLFRRTRPPRLKRAS